ncbi:MAG: DUF6384 family protein [Pirellulaceae bacterium]|jgi:hypothetical protein|nr:DUF6384 family protein [Pirellulaceae bacterium]
MPETLPAAAPAGKAPLDDVMLAMDVVDTLRHRSALVERELSAELREQQLIQRLREIYAAQGIEVPDHILAEGVAALAEDRFHYTPAPPSFSVTLAKIYIHRQRWLAPLFLAVALVAGVWLGYVFLVSAPRQRWLRELPRQVAAEQAAIDQLAQVSAAKEEAQKYAAAAKRSLESGENAAAQQMLSELEELRARLEQEYELRIVLEGSTGVWRIPDVNEAARNYYIIVQAITPDGKVLSQPITSEEDGQTRSVTKWGLRVDEATFQQIAADKQDDGIIQNNRFGVKKQGFLEPEYLLPTTGGAITSW